MKTSKNYQKNWTECTSRKLAFQLSKKFNIQKQVSRGVLSKRCPENMQQVYNKTLMPKWDINKVGKQLY